MKPSNGRYRAAWFVLIVLSVALASVPLRTRQGIDGKVSMRFIPLYIKAIEFIDRDFHYRGLIREIMPQAMPEQEKVLALFRWVRENVRTDYPRTWRIIDDHILNIIIRRYGTSDQVADVFTTLCVYGRIDAFWDKLSSDKDRKNLILSFVRIDGSWRVFDVFRGVYFKDQQGRIATIDDILSGKEIVSNEEKGLPEYEVDYRSYLINRKSVKLEKYLRVKRQMPWNRLTYEIKRLLFGEQHLAIE